MKTIYIKRNDLFKNLELLLCNKITEVDENFIENNYELFYAYPGDEEINEEIERLAQIDWSREEYKPYDITAKMSPEKIKKHLEDNYKEDIQIDLGDYPLEPYQYFLTNVDDYTVERLKEFGVELGYSELLDLHVLPIYDYGTSWDHFSYSKEVEDDYELGHNETLERTTAY